MAVHAIIQHAQVFRQMQCGNFQLSELLSYIVVTWPAAGSASVLPQVMPAHEHKSREEFQPTSVAQSACINNEVSVRFVWALMAPRQTS